MIDKIIFYDADFLFCFLFIDEVSLLKKAFKEIIVPKQVYDELTKKRSPQNVKNTIINLKNSGFIKVRVIDLYSKEYIPYKSIKNGNWHKDFRKLGKGESAALALAMENDGVIASNNLVDIKYYVDKYELPLLTTSYFLALAVDEEIISFDEAYDMYDRMIIKKRKLPCNSFEEYYNKLYEEDKEDFGFILVK